MNDQNVPDESPGTEVPEVAGQDHDNAILWGLALVGFAVAMGRAYLATCETPPMDLRTPSMLLVNVLLATLVALVYGVREGAIERWADLLSCLRFGLWSSAVFLLLPLIMSGGSLFHRNQGSIDPRFALVGACIHGGLTVVLSAPCAIRVYEPANHRWFENSDGLRELGGFTVLVFYLAAAVVRLTPEFNW
jgi:hypothetical protein